MKSLSHTPRLDAIRRLIRTRRVATQEELRLLLSEEGFDVTQATLSRDLANLSARRVSRAGRGAVYELEDAPVSDGDDPLGEVRHLVISVGDNGQLVVVNTLAGAASAVAVALDRARLPGILGTLAGDDTIFIAPARRVTAISTTKQLKTIWMKVNHDR